MLTLVLMRHAKSDWDDATLSDHDRPLNRRGRKSAGALGVWMAQSHLTPDQALVSSARRTQETFERLALSTPQQPLRALYHAGATTMRDTLRTATGRAVLMVGHNPGIADFAETLLGQPPEHPRFWDYPTGATLMAQFDITEWRALTWGSGRAVRFVVPREL